MKNKTRLDLRARILIVVISMVALGFAATVTVLTLKGGSMQREAASQFTQELAKRNSSQVQGKLEVALDAARTLAQTFEGMQATGKTDRTVADAALKSVLAGNPDFLAVWTCWEPGAFDGKDKDYADKPGHDASGRYVPYWNRGSGKIEVEPLTDYDKEGLGDYYQVPKKSGVESVVEPYAYKVAGKDVLITSLVVPIKHEGKFVGVAGIDVALSSIQEDVSKIRPYETGYASLISNNAAYLADIDSKNIGKDIGKGGTWDAIKTAIKAGKEYEDNIYSEMLHTQASRIYVPIRMGATTTPWSFSIVVPDDKALAGVATLRNIALVLGLLSVVLVSVALGFALDRMVIRRLGGEPEDAAGLAQKIAEGDLTTAVQLRPDDRSSTLYAMRAMQEQLARIVSGIRSISDFVSTATAEIAQGNSDLSRRTEDQAASLEETASSMEQMSATVKQNADNAKQANQLAVTASATATRGSAEVGQVVNTMRDIANESKKMSDIIAVIEGIAFQTNILALNAAVEAARAGEQGRGFAVVATEVRSLAQRSATASKEIKELIEASISKVNGGSAIVERAGKTMEEVMTAIRRVTDLMGEISAASAEQSSGIGQINMAITHMDEATQQNAALVEQAEAAANSLEDQARQLIEAVSVFKLDGMQSAAAAPAARQTPKATSMLVTRKTTPAKVAARTTQAKQIAHASTGSDDWEKF